MTGDRSTDLRAIALEYHGVGWHPLELPAGAKAPPPEGRTGGDGVDMSIGEIEAGAWSGNLGVRMPHDVVGLDVDVYRGGKESLDSLFARCGRLPLTFISHSGRDDGSGIRFYRVPSGLAWVSGVAGIDIIRRGHRYAVVWPSTHPDGRQYGWWDQTEGGPFDGMPEVELLPDMPWEWIEYLSRAGLDDVERGPLAVGGSELREFLAAHVEAAEPGYLTATIGAHFTERHQAGFSRHDSMQHCLIWAMEMVRAGVCSGPDAVAELAMLWQAATAPDARRMPLSVPGRVTEFEAMLRHAVGKAQARPEMDITELRWQVVGVSISADMPPVRASSPRPADRRLSAGDAVEGTPFVMRTLDQIPTDLPEQLVRGWFPRREVCILAGKPGVGKGVVMTDIVARGTRGEDMPNGDRVLGRFNSAIISLPGEDSVEDWARRLTVAKAEPERVQLIESKVDGRNVVEALEAAALRGAELIVIDSFTGLTNSLGFDTNKGEVRRVLDALSQAARRFNVTVVMLHHTRKAQGDPLDVLQGNTQIGAAARSVLVVVEERLGEGQTDPARLLGVAKLNGSRPSNPVGFRTVGAVLYHPDGAPKRDDRGDVGRIPRVEWITDRTFNMGDLLAASNGTVLDTGRDQAAATLLAAGPVLSTDFIEGMGQQGYGTSAAKAARKAVGGVIQHDRQWWSYPASMSLGEAKRAIVALVEPVDNAPKVGPTPETPEQLTLREGPNP